MRIVIEIRPDGVIRVEITQEDHDRLLHYLKCGGWIVGGVVVCVLDAAIHFGSHGLAVHVAAWLKGSL